VFIVLVIGISFAAHQGQVYYGNTGYWCWITHQYPGERIGLEYLWMWLAAFIDIFVYIFLALVVTGFVAANEGRIRINASRQPVSINLSSRRGTAMGTDRTIMAIKLLFYPAVYIFTVLPITVVRFIIFHNPNSHVPFVAIVFASMLFSSSGLLNVILFALTRPKLLRVREHPTPTPIRLDLTTSWKEHMPKFKCSADEAGDLG